jgi:hypothetical protein
MIGFRQATVTIVMNKKEKNSCFTNTSLFLNSNKSTIEILFIYFKLKKLVYNSCIGDWL